LVVFHPFTCSVVAIGEQIGCISSIHMFCRCYRRADWLYFIHSHVRPLL